ncbi:MAG: hypothetical protein GY866_02825 [Proteobacteria bacterium]|nr:hypothetical protein [Pseudomonadota bacterium]
MDALTPLPGDRAIVVGGDAGFCVEEFCEWLNEKRHPQEDFHQDIHFEGAEIHSRRLWRLPGLRHAVYPGIQEGFAVQGTNLVSLETDRQFLSSIALPVNGTFKAFSIGYCFIGIPKLAFSVSNKIPPDQEF